MDASDGALSVELSALIDEIETEAHGVQIPQSPLLEQGGESRNPPGDRIPLQDGPQQANAAAAPGPQHFRISSEERSNRVRGYEPFPGGAGPRAPPAAAPAAGVQGAQWPLNAVPLPQASSGALQQLRETLRVRATQADEVFPQAPAQAAAPAEGQPSARRGNGPTTEDRLQSLAAQMQQTMAQQLQLQAQQHGAAMEALRATLAGHVQAQGAAPVVDNSARGVVAAVVDRQQQVDAERQADAVNRTTSYK